MNRFAIGLAIAVAAISMLPQLTERRDGEPSDPHMDRVQINGVIYYDAPTSSTPIRRR
jgi:hypothetical protein